MQLNIGGKKYTFCYTVAATLCDDLLESVFAIAGAAGGKNERDASLTIGGKLPLLTKSLFYGGLLQMHGDHGDRTVTSKETSDDLLYQYLEENNGKREGTLTYIFNALYGQIGEDNFLSRIGMTEDESNVTPISKGKKVGGAN